MGSRKYKKALKRIPDVALLPEASEWELGEVRAMVEHMKIDPVVWVVDNLTTYPAIEKVLGPLAEAGDEDAADTLFRAHKEVVHNVAAPFLEDW